MKPQGKRSHPAPKLGAFAPNLGANTAHASAAEALFGRTRRAVLALLYGHPHESFHMRQIARAVGAGQGAVQRELRRLADTGILTRSPEGRLVRYQANRECPVFEELRGLLVKTAGMADVLRNALTRLEGRVRLAVLFGSSANGTFRSASDVDVLVVGTVTFADVVAALAPAQEALRREVNPVVYRPEEFAARLSQGDHFLKSVFERPMVLLLGDENDLAELVEKPLAG
jgi:predicted nucleotidyltransferase